MPVNSLNFHSPLESQRRADAQRGGTAITPFVGPSPGGAAEAEAEGRW